MFDTRDARRLLDQFLTPGGAAPQGGPVTPWSRAGGTAGASGASGAAPGDLMARAKEYLAGNGGSLASGAAAGALVSLVLGSKAGRKLGKNAVTLGGLALVGTLAYKAYQNYRSGNPPEQAATPVPSGAPPDRPEPARLPPPGSPFDVEAAGRGELPVTLLRTMIAAALADGHVDEAERAAITARLRENHAGALDEAARFLADELARPASVEDIARAVANEAEAAEVYISALLAIDPDSTAERAFLARLALALRLDPALTPHLEAAARAARAG
ncbi:tellurite resistance TerB family protein [Ancylobacter lacus]|uniref:tellurite resistance TerB family protein n=1 Tax=Ancylobacter lacus TaxID=2579970 RepID=UPI001BCFBE61|nr:DUF533 domain-containing protein [Ancylobacter lacus]MBS7540143.1 DUF533 domain-containing protein [Ancylobacter lacus]